MCTRYHLPLLNIRLPILRSESDIPPFSQTLRLIRDLAESRSVKPSKTRGTLDWDSYPRLVFSLGEHVAYVHDDYKITQNQYILEVDTISK